ncbi:MAG TPA: histidine kinase [Flavisolibacter sp.]
MITSISNPACAVIAMDRRSVYAKADSVDSGHLRGKYDDIYRGQAMKRFFNIKRLRLYLWISLAFFALWLTHISQYPGTFFERSLNNVWRIIYLLVLNYIFFEHAVPFIGRKRRTVFHNILIAIPVVFVILMFYSWGLFAWRLLGIGLGLYTPLATFTSVPHGVQEQMTFSMSSIVFFGVVRHLYLHFKLQQAAQQLRLEKQQAELSYLKSQTNPHFLFNTLNNIYALARDKSDLAAESILRLSKILRFMLYETTGDFISVEQELRIISDYIALEQLRYDESLRVSFNHDIEDMRQALPPLLLMPLVENAFKHGTAETRVRPYIDIHLSINNRILRFIVKNSVEETMDEKPVKENIGLANLRRQLELLYREYELQVVPGKSVFTATLTINLASHV